MPDRTSQNAVENIVFFDFLGAFVIRWPLYISSTINVLSISIGIYSVYMNMQNARRGKYEYWLYKSRKRLYYWYKLISCYLDAKKFTYLKHLLMCVAVIVSSWLLSSFTCTAIALTLTKLGKVMSWYVRPAWLFFLYVCPTVFMSMILFLYVGTRQKKVKWLSLYIHLIIFTVFSIVIMLLLIDKSNTSQK